MRLFLNRFNQLGDVINRIALTISEIALLILMLITAYAVIARYIFHSPSIFAVEISTYLLLIVSWGAVGWVHRVNRHVSMEALNVRLTGFWKKATDVISELTILIFCSVLVWAGTNVVITAFERNYRSASLMKFPLWIAYAVIPIGGVLLGLIALRRLQQPGQPIVDTPSKGD